MSQLPLPLNEVSGQAFRAVPTNDTTRARERERERERQRQREDALCQI